MATISLAQVKPVEQPVESVEEDMDDWLVHIKEEMPRFPGCEEVSNEEERKKCSEKKLLTFIYSRIKLRPHCQPVEGTVIVQFTVEKDGQLTNIKILREIFPAYGEEVIQIIKQMPRWIPGRQMGKVVPVRYTIPVRFKAS